MMDDGSTRSAARPIPRFVPTLTEVVVWPELPLADAIQAPSPAAPADSTAPAAPAAAAPAQPGQGFEEDLIHRVMQRVDGVLEQRLREAVQAVVTEQTRAMPARLREEVEAVVRSAVYEAVAQELPGA